MEERVKERVREANLKVRSILSFARNALAGRQQITSDDIRDISKPLTDMGPIVSRATGLRDVDINLDAELKEYAENLGDLQDTLERLRFMLLARQTQVESARLHLETVNLWAAAFKQTR